MPKNNKTSGNKNVSPKHKESPNEKRYQSVNVSKKESTKKIGNVTDLSISNSRSTIEDDKILSKTDLRPSRRPSIHASKINKIDSEKDSKTDKKLTPNNPLNWKSSILWVIGSIILLVAVIKGFEELKPSSHPNEHDTNFIHELDELKKEFPHQYPMLWKALKSGINETVRLNYPSSYIFLHELGYHNVVEKLIEKLSRVAIHALDKRDMSAIKLNKEILESHKFNEYGSFIGKFKDPLEKSGVMLVENLDEIPEKYALAFHSFCDSIEPLVKNAIFFFTMKVDKFDERTSSDTRIVEKILKEKWKGLKDDTFEPLFTRISPMLLRIQPEL